MSHRGENIYKRKDGRWEAGYIKGYREDRKIIYSYKYAGSYNKVRLKQNAATTKSQVVIPFQKLEMSPIFFFGIAHGMA